MTPSGEFSEQIGILKQKADTYASRIQSPRLSTADINTFMRTTYAPAMGYVLPCLAVDEEELNQVQSQLLAAVLSKVGFSRKTPTPLRHGPKDMGGLALIDLRTEMGISQLRMLRHAIFANTEVGKMALISLKYSQIEAGVKEHLLEVPGKEISYLTPTWMMSVRQFLFQHNLTLTVTDCLNIRMQGQHDQCIMNTGYLANLTRQQRWDVNLVRLYLQVITLADMSEASGRCIKECFLRGAREPNQCRERNNWPRQGIPTNHQISTWAAYIRTHYIQYGNKWKHPLGNIQPNNWEEYKEYTSGNPYKSKLPVHYESLRHYIRSLPTWYKRLLATYSQKAPDHKIWKSFQSRRQQIDIVSDRGLADQVGTFGWKIRNNARRHRTLRRVRSYRWTNRSGQLHSQRTGRLHLHLYSWRQH
jgi:hypothetical protein